MRAAECPHKIGNMTKKSQTQDIPPKIAKLSFEDALSELEVIVGQLQEGNVSLEESIDIYARGTQLRRHCEAKLRDAQEKIEKIIPNEDGSIGIEKVDFE